jgi:hypothetical protein
MNLCWDFVTNRARPGECLIIHALKPAGRAFNHIAISSADMSDTAYISALIPVFVTATRKLRWARSLVLQSPRTALLIIALISTSSHRELKFPGARH